MVLAKGVGSADASRFLQFVLNNVLLHCLLPLPSEVRGEWTDGGTKDGLANVNETISFNYTIGNNGSTSLLDVCLTDANFGSGCLDCTAPGIGIVSPGAIFTCDFIYEVRQISN